MALVQMSEASSACSESAPVPPTSLHIGGGMATIVHWHGTQANLEVLLSFISSLTALNGNVVTVSVWLHCVSEPPGDLTPHLLEQVKHQLMRLDSIVIGIVDGTICSDGIQLLQACDVVVASTRSRFDLSIGTTADEAKELGIVDTVVEDNMAVINLLMCVHTLFCDVSTRRRRSVKAKFLASQLSLRRKLAPLTRGKEEAGAGASEGRGRPDAANEQLESGDKALEAPLQPPLPYKLIWRGCERVIDDPHGAAASGGDVSSVSMSSRPGPATLGGRFGGICSSQTDGARCVTQVSDFSPAVVAPPQWNRMCMAA
eukprot:TRINITY_DN21415_c0_g1_i1.p1 TRINITY_DN21415_c0_g1~~TRINITY_DN21415_c0_g1_i1.p1  ORF type:complete len:315 (-),score=35.04 TRINITY_DN21415_c0_g1_i1:74-1018(-)